MEVLSIPVKDAIDLKLDLILALAAKHETRNHVMFLIDALTRRCPFEIFRGM